MRWFLPSRCSRPAEVSKQAPTSIPESITRMAEVLASADAAVLTIAKQALEITNLRARILDLEGGDIPDTPPAISEPLLA